jgi:hypothetical protein
MVLIRAWLFFPTTQTLPINRDRLLELIENWATEFRQHPESQIVVDTYEELRRQGIQFPDRERTGPRAPIFTPPVRMHTFRCNLDPDSNDRVFFVSRLDIASVRLLPPLTLQHRIPLRVHPEPDPRIIRGTPLDTGTSPSLRGTLPPLRTLLRGIRRRGTPRRWRPVPLLRTLPQSLRVDRYEFDLIGVFFGELLCVLIGGGSNVARSLQRRSAVS